VRPRKLYQTDRPTGSTDDLSRVAAAGGTAVRDANRIVACERRSPERFPAM
jgi:hypothetical protein